MTTDVVVVGAGIIGCAIARRLARSGASVVVVDREAPGKEASWAAAGMLAPQAEADGPGPFFDLLLRARGEFPALAAELKEETGIDVAYRAEGLLRIAFSDTDEAELDRRIAWQREAGLAVELLPGDEARALEPALSPRVRRALLFPGDHQVDNRLLVRALWFSAERAGARFRLGVGVHRLVPRASEASIELADGERIDAATVVLAAGAWSGMLAGLPRPLPMVPVHGQLIGLETAPPVFRHIVASAAGYLVPRADGRLIVGATSERVGFRAAVTPDGLRRLCALAVELAPTLADRPVLDHWSGLRPGTPDDLPILGPDPAYPRLLYATGHYRNGILLAPLTARIIEPLALGNPPIADLEPYRVERFGGTL